MNSVDKKKVEEFFTAAASKHQNENAVLDVAAGQEHPNIYRDYFTRNYILKNLAPKKNQTILDFGCGVGRITKLIGNKSAAVVGADTNAAMIESAKKISGTHKNISYQLMKEIKIISSENYFDAAFSHWVFQHISDDETVLWLKEIKRVLKTTGKILLFEQIKTKTTESDKHMFRSPQHYKSLIENSGLKISSAFAVMRVPARGMSVWNKLPSWKFLLPFVSFIDLISINRKPELADYFTCCFVLSK